MEQSNFFQKPGQNIVYKGLYCKVTTSKISPKRVIGKPNNPLFVPAFRHDSCYCVNHVAVVYKVVKYSVCTGQDG